MEQTKQKKEVRRRLRDLGISIGKFSPGGISIGKFSPGPLNAITDVPGVHVGHATIIKGQGRRRRGQGPVRTGVTAILPNAGESFMKRVVGGAFILNGAGEMSGLIQVLEWGLIETPILLTNTLAVGIVADATVQYMVERYPGIGDEQDVVIPLVGECDDSFLNDIAGTHIKKEHVFEALDSATGGPVAEGNGGGGTGMVSFDLKGGILFTISILRDRYLDPLYQAVIECTEEAILNALCMAETMEGANGHVAPALPIEEVAEMVRRMRG